VPEQVVDVPLPDVTLAGGESWWRSTRANPPGPNADPV
jgi:hypothetical protein